MLFIKSQKEGPTVQAVQASRSHHPRLPKHLYPLIQGFRKFSPKPLLLEALEAVSQSGTDENHSHRIVSEGCSREGLSHRKMPALDIPMDQTLLGNGVRESSRDQSHQHRVWHTKKNAGK